MENVVVATPTLQAQLTVDRTLLRAELETTRLAFHRLVGSLTDEGWRTKSPNSAWTMGEVLVHLTWALEQLPAEIAGARLGKGMFNFPKPLAPLVDLLSYWLNRWFARNATPASLLARYDAAMTAVLHTLDAVEEGEWGLGANFYGHGFYTIADLFHTPTEHFAEHTARLETPMAEQ